MRWFGRSEAGDPASGVCGAVATRRRGDRRGRSRERAWRAFIPVGIYCGAGDRHVERAPPSSTDLSSSMPCVRATRSMLACCISCLVSRTSGSRVRGFAARSSHRAMSPPWWRCAPATRDGARIAGDDPVDDPIKSW